MSDAILDLLQEKGVPIRRAGEHHHVRGAWIGIDCPLCSPNSGRFRLGYHPGYRAFTCWMCGTIRRTVAVQALTGASGRELYELLATLPQAVAVRARKVGTLKIPPGVGPLLAAHKTFLRTRGFDPDEIAETWGIKGIGNAAYLPWRLWIPVTLYNGIVSWTTRSLREDGARYSAAPPNQEAIPIKSLLYGEDYAGSSVVVVEGPTDAWRIGPGAVATLGVAFSKDQILRLSRYPDRVICFDSEPKAQERARRLADFLGVFPGRTRVVELDAADPGSAGPKEVARLRKMIRRG